MILLLLETLQVVLTFSMWRLTRLFRAWLMDFMLSREF